ncbi:peptide chain release factor N(5)-glutamine methyltransferase [Cochlodiniinecator piscidefendens]|uniref:peptide chain release factor N(5)-glutamine methyltransferase n=1 Tax=Cochlodiniinecator piscidefendens TaxID=2715756 RepID=UPI001407865D|nr:peptide chain release factor N(5)-glutamine methyltransferase [Cochlodiniinecator piscidefendens]
MIAQAALVLASRRLAEAGVEGAPRDARRLLAHVLGVELGRVTLITQDDLSEHDQTLFEKAVERRALREPLSHITGTREFYGRVFTVTSDVLDPRPDTELLVDVALRTPFHRVLDLGTGSGCILLSVLSEQPEATGVGVDLSEKALAVADRNMQNLGLSERATLRQSNWWDNVEGTFDLILSNPPYIREDEMADLSPEVQEWEPHLALTPGGDGLAAYREIIDKAAMYLNPNSRLAVEIGAEQDQQVANLFKSAGYRDIFVERDMNEKDRVVCGRRP